MEEKEKLFRGLMEEKDERVKEKDERVKEKDEQLSTAMASVTLHEQTEAKAVAALIDVRKQQISASHWGQSHSTYSLHFLVLTDSYRFCHSHRHLE